MRCSARLRHALLVTLAVLLAGTIASGAPAADPPSRSSRGGTSVASAAGERVEVRWSAATTPSGRPCVRFAVGEASLLVPCASAAQVRREGPRLARRLALVAASRDSLAAVAVGRGDDGPALTWRGCVVLPATQAQAESLSLTSAEALVEGWVARLRAAARDARDATRVPQAVELGVGETCIVALPPSWSGASVKLPDGAGLTAGLVGHRLRVCGRSPGNAVIHLVKGTAVADLEITILESAGRLPTHVRAQIAGAAPEADFVDDACERVIDQAAASAEGAQLTLFSQGGRAGVGGSRVYTAWLEGEMLRPVVGRVTVSVTLSSAQFGEAAALAASNHPERIDVDGALLDTPIGSGATVFYFHHQNAPEAPPRFLQVSLVNRTASPVELLLAESGAGPSRDELYAVHLAAWRYVRWLARGSGVRMRLGPREALVLDARLLASREIACGMGRIAVLSGTPPSLVVEAMSADASQGSTASAPPPPLSAVVRGKGLFGPPVREGTAEYSVGGPYTFVTIGGPPYDEPLGEGSPNVGSYGVEHRIRLLLRNPTAEQRKVYVVFAVGGGLARGTVMIDGRVAQTPLMRASGPREFGLGEYLLPPMTKQEAEVRLIPEPGSNYPVRIVLKPLPANQ